MTPLQQLMEDINSDNIIPSSIKMLVSVYIQSKLKEEKEHLIGMCDIGSRNPGINPEKVFNTKYNQKTEPIK